MKNEIEFSIEDRIQKARELLRELDTDKRESPFEKARRFLVIQESLIRFKRVNVEN